MSLLFAALALLSIPPAWGAADDPLFEYLPDNDQRLTGTRISHDGTQVRWRPATLGGVLGFAILVDLATGDLSTVAPETPLPQTVNSVSADGRFRAVVVDGDTFAIRDQITGDLTVFLEQPGAVVTLPPVISADGSTAVFQIGTGLVQRLLVGDRATGTSLIIDPELDPVLAEVDRISISDDGRAIASSWIYGPQFAMALFVHRNPGPPPVAECRSLLVDTDPGLCTASVEASAFDAGSSDPRGRPLTFSVSPAGPYPLGTTDVVLTVSNGENSATCPSVITVRDHEPPQIACEVELPLLLARPGRPLVDVGLLIESSDNCEVVSVELSVTQDEPVHGPGDPSPDAEVLRSSNDDIEGLRLRAERAEDGDGRVYLIRATATDASGNQSTGVCSVVVPRRLTIGSLISAIVQGILAELFEDPLPYDSESQAIPVQTG